MNKVETSLKSQIETILLDKIKRSIKNTNKQEKLAAHILGNHMIYAAFQLHDTNSNKNSILSIGVGSKNVSNDLIQNNKCLQIKDCHAEIQAKRGLHNTLWNELEKLESDIDSDFFYIKESGKIQLKENFELWLVCNKAPCGDCSQTYCTTTNKMLTYTNALPLRSYRKCIKHLTYQENQELSTKVEEFNIIIDTTSLCEMRMKPCRKDFPQKKLGLSYSCSDKIMFWNILGVQGNLLSNFYAKLNIDKLVILNETSGILEKNEISDDLLIESISRGINYEERFPEKDFCKKMKNVLVGYKEPSYNEP